MRQAKEREVAQRGRSSWVVPRKPRPFKASSKPIPPPVSAESDFDVASMPFGLRLESLYLRCRLIILEDAVFMSSELKKLPSSKHTVFLLESLHAVMGPEAQDHIARLNTMIAESASKNLKRLEVELRLIQISFHAVLDFLRISSHVNVSRSLREMLGLCSAYPDTAGLFFLSCDLVKRIGSESPQKWKIHLYNMPSNELWKRWAAHEVGALTHCTNGHPYSRYTFADCPECGRYFAPSKSRQQEEDEKDYGAHLKEDQFREKMKSMRIKLQTEVQSDVGDKVAEE